MLVYRVRAVFVRVATKSQKVMLWLYFLRYNNYKFYSVLIKTCSTAFIRLTFLNTDDGPQDSLRTCYRTSSSCPIKDSQGHDNPNPQVAFVVAVRFASLLPSSATDKINEGATIRRAGGQMSGRVCSARLSGKQTWVFWAAWQWRKEFLSLARSLGSYLGSSISLRAWSQFFCSILGPKN